MNQKTKDLLDMGIKKDMAIALTWKYYTSEEKGNLTFKELVDLLDLRFFEGQAEIEGEIWELVAAKAKTLSNILWVFRNFSCDAQRRVEILQKAIKKIKTFDEAKAMWRWLNNSNNEDEVKKLLSPSDIKIVWKKMILKVDDFDKILSIWRDADPSYRHQAWETLISKAKTLFHYRRILAFSNDKEERREALDLAKKRIEVEDLSKILEFMRRRKGEEKKEIVELFKTLKLKSAPRTFEGFYNFYMSLRCYDLDRPEVWEIMAVKAVEFSDFVKVFKTAPDDRKDESWKNVKAKAETLKDWNWILKNSESEEEKKEIYEIMSGLV